MKMSEKKEKTKDHSCLVKAKTWERLQKYGTFGNSFDEVITHILDAIDKV